MNDSCLKPVYVHWQASGIWHIWKYSQSNGLVMDWTNLFINFINTQDNAGYSRQPGRKHSCRSQVSYILFLSSQDVWHAIKMTPSSRPIIQLMNKYLFWFKTQIWMIPHIYSVSNCLPPVQRPRSCLLATWGLAIPPAIQLPHKQSHSVWLAVGTPRWTGGLLRRLPRLTLAVALIELDRSRLPCC